MVRRYLDDVELPPPELTPEEQDLLARNRAQMSTEALEEVPVSIPTIDTLSIPSLPEPARTPASEVTKAPPAAPIERPVLLRKAQDLYGDELSDEAIKRAQAARNQTNTLALFGMAGNQIASGLASRSGAQVNPESAVLSEILKRSNQGVEDIQARRAAKDQVVKSKAAQLDLQKAQLETNDKAAMSDPKSSISKLYREVASKRLKLDLPDTVSASTMEKIIPLIKREADSALKFQQGGIDSAGNKLVFDPSTGEYRSSGMQAADTAFTTTDPRTGEKLILGRRLGNAGEAKVLGGKVETEEGKPFTRANLNPVQIKAIDDTREALIKDPTVKATREALAEVSKAENLIKENIPGSAGAIRRSLLKMFESGGRFTDQDVAQFGGAQDVVSKIDRLITEQATKRGLTKDDQMYLTQLLEVIKRENAVSADKAAAFFVDSLAKKGLPEDFARSQATDFLIPGKKSITPEAVEKIKVVAPNGKTGSIPKSQLEAAMKQGYKLVK